MSNEEFTKPSIPAVKVDSTLSKGLSILETLAGSTQARGVTDLSRQLQLTKSNTYRLLKSLSELGYVRSTKDKRYEATTKVWQIGLQVIENLNICQIAAPQMRKLSALTGEAIYLAIPDDLSVVYIDKLESTRPIRTFTPKGGIAPIHCVGTGKALLAVSYERLRERLKDNLKSYTRRTITSIKKMDLDVQETLDRGCAIDTGEYREHIMSFGAAILLPDGSPIAAIGVSAPEFNLSQDRIEEICQATIQAASSVSGSISK